MYTLGSLTPESQQLLLKSSHFSSTSIQEILPTEQLVPRAEFSALWFSYESYDRNAEHEVEYCLQKMSMGKQVVLLTPGTVHRVWAFVSRFLDSLEAHPLLMTNTGGQTGSATPTGGQ